MTSDRIPTPAPADRPSFHILIDGVALETTYQVQAVVVARGFNRVASAELLIHDGDPAAEDFAASNAEEFLPGQEIEIHAGYHGNEERIFLGIVVRHGLRVYPHKPSVLRLECRDAAVRLTVGRKSAYFYDVTDSEMIEEIASATGLRVDAAETAVLHPQMVQYHATDWDFIVTRVEANGQLLTTRDGELVTLVPSSDGEPVLNLTYGRNMLDFEVVADARDQLAEVTATGWDAAGQEVLSLDGADAGLETPGNLDAASLAEVAGPERFELGHGGWRSDAELQAWADGKRRRSTLAKVCGRVQIQGFPDVQPGDSIELTGVGDRFAGKAMVSGVRHEIDVGNWRTNISFGLSPKTFASCHPDIAETAASGLLPATSGLHIGSVTALEGDPAGEHRIQVRVPLIDPAAEGIWARVATLDAGDDRGTIFRPEIGDEVVLGFLDDDPRDPVMLGMLHSSAKPAPLEASDDNPQKGLVTRSGLRLLFDDDASSITIETPNGNSLVLSDDVGGVTIEDENQNRLVMDAAGITIESAADLTLQASGDITIQGANVSSSASAQLKVEGSAGAELSSGGSTVVKGSMVQIN